MSGLNIKQLVEHIICPVLDVLDMNSLAARRLLVGTGLVESQLSYIQQLGGPAKGIYQMEPITHDDIWVNYLKYRPRLAVETKNFLVAGVPRSLQLQGNLYYATAMARLHYRRIPDALPGVDDAEAMALYHKEHFNTHLGKTDPEKSIHFFKTAINQVQ